MLKLNSLLVFCFLISQVQCLTAGADRLKLAASDLEFAKVGLRSLLLNLHRPVGKQTGPLIVYVHGGAWRSGSRKEMPLGLLVEKGYAVASVDYRLSIEQKFPAQVHDIKAAIRFLRARQKELGIEAKQIVIAGSSAGGHLAALVGVSNGHAELEGTVGEHLHERSDVQGILSFYGGANLTSILSQSTPHGLKVRLPALELLLGGPPEEKVELARLASPVFHVDRRDPPLFLIHGDQDLQMPINQAHELIGAYKKAGRSAHLEVLHGGGHGGREFYDLERMELVRRFLEKVRSTARSPKLFKKKSR